MRRIILTLAILTGVITLNAQTYYNMWRGGGEAGKPEWIANTAMEFGFTGIRFTTADRYAGHVNSQGRWLFWDPNASVRTSAEVNRVNNNLNGIEHLSAATQGFMAARRWIVTDINLSNAIDSYWGYGRNGHILISNEMSGLLRINSFGGIGFWGNGSANENDTPPVLISSTQLLSKLPFYQQDGSISYSKNNISAALQLNSNSDAIWFGTTTSHGIEIGTNGLSALYIGNGQNLFVGFDKAGAESINNTLKQKYGFFVKKGILSEDYAIAPVNTWSDFVFSKEFQLKPLHEIETFINENQHLPDVPSAKKVAEEGYSQHEINKVLLQKIEELTLYTIQQQKEIEILKSKLQNQK